MKTDRPLLIAYFPAGDPRIPVDMLDVYLRCRVDVVELAIRSDTPFLDGRTIRASMHRSLGSGTIDDAQPALRRLDQPGSRTAALIFGYASQTLLESAVRCGWQGVDGLLCAPEAAGDRATRIERLAHGCNVRICSFVPYRFGDSDIARARGTSGYVMLQGSRGKTGRRERFDPTCGQRVFRLRGSGVTAPVVIGFGIGTPDHCRQAVESGADGVVIGSQAVARALKGDAALEAFLMSVRSALDG